MFGTIYDPDFGETYETGIMITMADLFETKRKRYIEPYVEYLKLVLAERREAKRLARKEKENLKGEKKEAKKKFALPKRKSKRLNDK